MSQPSKVKFRCCHCQEDLTGLITVTPGEVPLRGDLVLCGGCARVNVVWEKSGLDKTLSLRALLQSEYESLSPDERKDLMFAVRNILAEGKRRKGKILLPEWFK